MNDYTRGAWEALNWVEQVLEDTLRDTKEASDSWSIVLREVKGALRDIKKGVAVDFRSRLRATS